jgi:hypothetical protein
MFQSLLPGTWRPHQPFSRPLAARLAVPATLLKLDFAWTCMGFQQATHAWPCTVDEGVYYPCGCAADMYTCRMLHMSKRVHTRLLMLSRGPSRCIPPEGSLKAVDSGLLHCSEYRLRKKLTVRAQIVHRDSACPSSGAKYRGGARAHADRWYTHPHVRDVAAYPTEARRTKLPSAMRIAKPMTEAVDDAHRAGLHACPGHACAVRKRATVAEGSPYELASIKPGLASVIDVDARCQRPSCTLLSVA